MLTRIAIAAVFGLALVGFTQSAFAEVPKEGEMAKNFNLKSLGGEKVELKKLLKSGPVVLVVIRGYPGYQCPICSKQVGEFIKAGEAFKGAKANVVFVYPGPGEKLEQYAKEFTKGKTYPDNFHLVTDPDYTFTNSYDLRWDAKNETAYPSTFVISPEGKIVYAKVSKSHAGRSSAADVLNSLEKN